MRQSSAWRSVVGVACALVGASVPWASGGCLCAGPAAALELEACGDDTNGGCNARPEAFEELGFTPIYGTAWAAGGERDEDWYRFTTFEPGPVSITLEHDFVNGSAFFLVTGVCDAPAVGADGSTPACEAGVISTFLPAGDHYIFVAQDGFDGAPCSCPSEGTEYVIRQGSSGTPACVLECDGTSEPDACDSGDPGEPIESDCCINNGTPGCDDAACEALVCAADSFCCDTSWDQVCADIALDACEVCIVEGSVPDPNGGCNSTPPAFGEISFGETICGEAPASGGVRDTDWYNFALSHTSDVQITVSSQFDAVVFLLDATDCDAIVLIDQVFNPAAAGGMCNECDVSTLSIEGLAAGEYTIFVAAGDEVGGIFEGVFCGLNAGYALTYGYNHSDIGACCHSACACSIETPDDCFASGGTFFGYGTSCTDTMACPICPGDLDYSEAIDSADLNLLLAAFGQSGAGDLDCDGDTDSQDLNILLARFGTCCE